MKNPCPHLRIKENRMERYFLTRWEAGSKRRDLALEFGAGEVLS